MKNLFFLFLTLCFVGCGISHNKKSKSLNLKKRGLTSVVVVGAEKSPELVEESKKRGLILEGNSILRITGDAEEINKLNLTYTNDLFYSLDSKLELKLEEGFSPEKLGLYLAKKDFGIPEFWEKFPQADGRGVKVGVIDDGISPHQVGFQKTSTGERKFLAKKSQSSLHSYNLHEDGDFLSAEIVERKSFDGSVDLNKDGEENSFNAKVSLDGKIICLDLDLDKKFNEDECGGSFSETGDYFILPKNKRLVLMAEVELDKKILKLFQPEEGSDSHGEGVASVLAGYRIGNIDGFDGVAPGAQILDYDLSEKTDKPEENEYTIGTFLLALDWLASQGVEVANVSYSLFFTSVESQVFMSKAIDEIVKKHNIVISFSAGNNGPGLGSLNRREIYPLSVLVAGAYVSKELDERVHGVTGLPDEGRVVFYSSRGPGAGGLGPLLISPLSSLVHSSPDGGMRAFSGTSSASPALAGAATVLISAIKQMGLQFDAPTVVHALRLSGKRLQNEPFVSQGYGLPQLEKALEIYKSLINGERFMSVKTQVEKSTLDGISTQGIFLRTSLHSEVETYRINLTGVISDLALSSTPNLVTPVFIKYGKGVSGAREHWISSSANRLFIDVVMAEVLDGRDEGFSEIQIFSQLDQSLLAVVPITVVNDLDLSSSPSRILKVSSQEGARMHLYSSEGVMGYKVRARLVKGSKSLLNFATYDTNYIRTNQFSFNPEFFVSTPVSGHYQLTLHMSGGTKQDAEVEFDVEEVRMKLLTKNTSAEDVKIKIENISETHFSGKVLLKKQERIVKSLIFTNSQVPEIELSLGEGEYSATLTDTESYELNYLYSQCHIQEKNENGKFIPVEGSFYTVKESEKVTLKFRCVPFDRVENAKDSLSWKMSVLEEVESKSKKTFLSSFKKTNIDFGKLDSGEYNVFFASDLSPDELISIGKISIN